MRLRDLLLLENQYTDMMSGLQQFYPETYDDIVKRLMTDVRSKLRRKDRMVWFIRWYRARRLMDVMSKNKGSLDIKSKTDKLKSQYSKALGLDPATVAYEMNIFSRNYGRFLHFGELVDCPQVQNIVWDKQLPNDLLYELTTAEREWIQSQDQVIKYHHEDEHPEVFLDLGNGWAWYDLNQYSCDREAQAMGHCGNSGGNSDQTILSLRHKVGDNKFRPSLTFILHSDGTLGEMKGRANEKPSEKYHPAIIALLKDQRITGLTGGGYLPQNNFSMQDLKPLEKQEIQQSNPHMRDLQELYYWYKEQKSDNPAIESRLTKMLRADIAGRGHSSLAIDIKMGEIIESRYNTFESYMDDYNSYTKWLSALFDEELPKLLSRHTSATRNQAESISFSAKADLFPEMFQQLLPYDFDLVIGGGGPVIRDGKIIISISIDDYFEYFWGNSDSSRLEYLEEVSDHDPEIDHLIEEETDDLKAMILEYLENMSAARSSRSSRYDAIKWPSPSPDIAEEVYRRYSRHADASFTQSDPNQREFNFTPRP